MVSPLVLSKSSVITYLRCGKQFWYAYIERRKEPPSVKQLLGRATHEAVEVNYVQKMASMADLPVAEVVDAFSTAYDREVGDIETPDEDTGKAKDDGVRMTKHYQAAVAPGVQPEMVEEPVQFEVNGIPYSGVIDLVANKRIRDLKTTGRAPSKEAAHRLELTGYALGYRHKTGEQESGTTLDYIVRTKKPQYIPIETGPVSNREIQAYATTVKQVSDAIEAGTFLPNGLVGNPPACSWCGFKRICPDYQKSRL